MAQQLSKTGIVTTQTVEAWHVSQSVDAFTALEAYDIDISGSLDTTGPVSITGDLTTTGRVYLTTLTNTVTPQIVGYVPANGRLYYLNTSSLSVASASFASTASFIATASWSRNAITASFVATASYSPNIYNTDGTLTGARVIDQNGENLTFLANTGNDFIINSNPAGNVTIESLTTGPSTNILFQNPTSGKLFTATTASFTSSWAVNALTASLAISASYSPPSVSASYALTASYIATASFVTTSSWARNAITASYAPNIYNTNGALTGNRQLDLNGNNLTFLAQTGDITITSNPSYVVAVTNIPQQSKSSLVFYNNVNGQLTYNTTASFTSSWAENAVTASHALSASYSPPSISASYALTASYVPDAIKTVSSGPTLYNGDVIRFTDFDGNIQTHTVTYVASASYVNITGSGVLVNYGPNGIISLTGSAGGTTDVSTYLSSSITGSTSASWAGTASYTVTASYVPDAIKTVSSGPTNYNGDVIRFTEFDGTIQTHTVIYVASASYAVTASHALSASYSPPSVSASYAATASYVATASYSPNIYNIDGALDNNRTLDLNGNNFNIVAQTGDFIITSDPLYTVAITDIPQQSKSSLVFYNDANGALTYNTTASFTSSWASNAVTSSYTVTASYVDTAYLSAYSTANQNISVGTAGQAITCDNIDFSRNITLTGGSGIRILQPGKYNIQFSLQMEEAGSSGSKVWIWLRKNSSNVSNSNTQFDWRVRGVAAWNFFVDAEANDIFEIFIASQDAGNLIVTESGPYAGPDIPSVILTVNKID